MIDRQPYAAAFRNGDDTVRWQRFWSAWEDGPEIADDIKRTWQLEPLQITDGWTGETLWRDRAKEAEPCNPPCKECKGSGIEECPFCDGTGVRWNRNETE